jgi:hypothetical protein
MDTDQIWLAFKSAMRKRIDLFNKEHPARRTIEEPVGYSEGSAIFTVIRWAYQRGASSSS